MLKDITLGQYFPGNSALHRMDPRMKIILMLLYIIMIFLAHTIYSYAAVLLSAVVLVIISRIPWKLILRGVKPLIFIIVFTGIINVFWTEGEDLLFQWGVVAVYREGIEFAVFMIVRIVTLILGTGVLLSYTTSPIALTDGIERLLSPLKKIKVPVHEFSMMMSIALRFIPTLMEETDKIMSAQKARGADFTTGSIMQRARALIPVFIPLIVSAFRRADELAVAMECRCYHGGEGRTRMTQLHLHGVDFLMLAVIIFMGAVIVALNYLPL